MSRTLMAAGAMTWAVGALTGEGLALAGAGIALVGIVAEAGGALGREHWRGLLVLTAMIGLAWASALWAPRPLRSGAPWSAAHVALFPLAVLLGERLSSAWRRRLLGALVGLALAGAMLCVAQHYGWLAYLEVSPKWVPMFRAWEPAGPGRFMAGGFHFHRLKYAHTLVPLALGVGPALWRLADKRGRGVLLLLAALLLASLAFTYTRASWLGLTAGVAAGAAGWYASAARRRQAAIALLALTLIAPFLLLALGLPADRVVAWKAAAALFSSQPLAGVGEGGFATAALGVMGGANPVYPYVHLDAHSLVLQVLAERGLLGAGLLAAGLAMYARMLGTPTPAQLAVIACVAVLGVVHNLAFHPVVLAAVSVALAFDRGTREA